MSKGVNNWTPDLSDSDERKGTGKIITFLKNKIQYDFVLEDQVGTFGIVNKEEGVFVGRKETYGDTVSAHKRALASASNLDIPLIMWIDKSEKFYKFDQEDIIHKGEAKGENKKGDAKMVNFSIKKGEKYELPKRIQRSGA